MGFLYGLEEGVYGAMYALLLDAEPLGVGCPEYDHLVQAVLSLEFTDVRPNDIEVLKLIASGDDVICAITLVLSNEVGVVDGGEGNQVLHEGVEFLLEIILKDLCTCHCITQIHATDVPTSDHDVTGVHHWEDVTHGDKYLLLPTHSDLHGRALCDRSIEVGLDHAIASPV